MGECSQPSPSQPGSDAPSRCATSATRPRAWLLQSIRPRPSLAASSNCPLFSSSSQTLAGVSHLYAIGSPLPLPLHFWNHSASNRPTARRSRKERGAVLHGSNDGLFRGTSCCIDGRHLADFPGAILEHHGQDQHLARPGILT